MRLATSTCPRREASRHSADAPGAAEIGRYPGGSRALEPMPSILFRLSVGVLLAASASASAQAPASRPAWASVSAQVGAGAVAQTGTTTLGVSAQLHHPLGGGPVRLQAGGSYTVEVYGGGELAEAHLALGVGTSTGPLFASVVVGPSVGGTRPTAYETGIAGGGAGFRPLVGLYGAARADVAVLPVVGIGVEVSGNLNPAMPGVGVGLSLTFGRRAGALIR